MIDSTINTSNNKHNTKFRSNSCGDKDYSCTNFQCIPNKSFLGFLLCRLFHSILVNFIVLTNSIPISLKVFLIILYILGINLKSIHKILTYKLAKASRTIRISTWNRKRTLQERCCLCN